MVLRCRQAPCAPLRGPRLRGGAGHRETPARRRGHAGPVRHAAQPSRASGVQRGGAQDAGRARGERGAVPGRAVYRFCAGEAGLRESLSLPALQHDHSSVQMCCSSPTTLQCALLLLRITMCPPSPIHPFLPSPVPTTSFDSLPPAFPSIAILLPSPPHPLSPAFVHQFICFPPTRHTRIRPFPLPLLREMACY